MDALSETPRGEPAIQGWLYGCCEAADAHFGDPVDDRLQFVGGPLVNTVEEDHSMYGDASRRHREAFGNQSTHREADEVDLAADCIDDARQLVDKHRERMRTGGLTAAP